MENNELQTGKIYDTMINKESIGKTLYVGRISRRGITNRHVIIFDGTLGLGAYTFRNYSLEKDVLKITSNKKIHNRGLSLSPLEIEYLSSKFKETITQIRQNAGSKKSLCFI